MLSHLVRQTASMESSSTRLHKSRVHPNSPPPPSLYNRNPREPAQAYYWPPRSDITTPSADADTHLEPWSSRWAAGRRARLRLGTPLFTLSGCVCQMPATPYLLLCIFPHTFGITSHGPCELQATPDHHLTIPDHPVPASAYGPPRPLLE